MTILERALYMGMIGGMLLSLIGLNGQINNLKNRVDAVEIRVAVLEKNN